MPSTIQSFAFVLLLSVAGACLANTNDSCNSILRDGTMAKSDYRMRHYLRRLLHWRFSKQELEQSKRDTSFGADVPIYDILVGADFSQQEASDARRAIAESLDRDDIEQYTVHYMLASGDPVIAEAWTKCINSSKGGLFVWFSERKQNSAVLNVKFRSEENPKTTFSVASISLTALGFGKQPSSRTLPQNVCLYVGKAFKSGDECAVEVATTSSGESLRLVANGRFSTGGNTRPAVAFLPHGMKWIKSSDTIYSNKLQPPLIAEVSRGYPGEEGWGTQVCISRTAAGTGGTFIKPSVQATALATCPGDGACWGAIDSVTDDSVCWHSFVHTHYNSCQCLSAAVIGIIRSRWVDEDQLEPDPNKTNRLVFRPLQ